MAQQNLPVLGATHYGEFLARKRVMAQSVGFDVIETAIHPRLFPFQRDIVRWALKSGRAAIFADTGLGKTTQQVEWAKHVHAHTGGDVLILAPLQLEVIRRAVRLWTNPGDVVLSPFMGIGSEGYVALQMHRRFIGAELKGSYFEQAVANLNAAIEERDRPGLFAEVGL